MSDTRNFVHLHCHSHYSLLDGAGTTKRLVARAAQLKMPALALTDHGNLYGAIQFYKQAREKGVKPILGIEAYIAPGSRHDRTAGSTGGPRDSSFHLTLLAMNRTGFQNLLRLSSLAFLEGFYYKPRIDRQLLQAHNEGILCLSGCASGEVNRQIQGGHMESAEATARWYQEVFGDRYFLEIQNNGLDIQRISTAGCIELSQRLGIPLVATSDVHYVNRDEADAQDLLLCINTGKFRTDENRMKMDSDEFYLKSPDEMYAAFPGLEDAVARSVQIADRIDIDLQLGTRHFPVYQPPDGKESEEYLRELCIQGLRERYEGNEKRMPGGELSQEVNERLDHELSVISKQGYPNYFLIVWDFVRFARERNIQATARGSGVGSLVCFSLYMSHVCPLEYDLLFERFLDVNRAEAPDIDIDFEKERRAEVLQYVKNKYGVENVAQIGTFGTMAARLAVRASGRALGLPIPRVDQVVATIPDDLGIKLEKAVQQSEQLRELMEKDPDARELIEASKSVEGLVKNVGTHACAVVIANRPLIEYVPLQHIGGKDDVVTQWEGPDVEEAGLLKMDFLGLRNLTILSRSVALIEQTSGEKIDPYRLPLDDGETFALLCRGETKGIFQLESGGIRDLLQRMKPDHFHDIIATSALYRPGPLEGGMVDTYVEVKHGRQEASYLHPIMEDVLRETHGVMVYQEQVMRILNRLGGIELADSYKCIKAISKKKLPIIAKYRDQFLTGSVEQGLSKKQAEELFGMIEKFAGYGFNKSHSTAYALIAYMTAYLKTHYPVEFMAALLSGDIPNRNFARKDGLVEHIEDCRRMGIEVVPPDVNRSEGIFTVEDGKIVFGLSAVKGCGGAAPEAIAKERKARGRFRDLFDFCERLDTSSVNRTAIEMLVKAGAMDSFGAKRSQLMATIDRAIQSGASRAKDRAAGQLTLFDLEENDDVPEVALPEIPEWEERDLLKAEKEVLGFYLTSHPLEEHLPVLKAFCTHSTSEAVECPDRTPVLLGGMIGAIKHSTVKNPKPGQPSRFASFDLEDWAGTMRCNLWPRAYEENAPMVQPDAIVAVRGTIDKRPGSEEANFSALEIVPIEQLDGRYSRGLRIRIDQRHHGLEGLQRLYEILRGYPGDAVLELLLVLEDGAMVDCQCNGIKIAVNSELRERVKELVGSENLQLLTRKPVGEERPKRRWERN